MQKLAKSTLSSIKHAAFFLFFFIFYHDQFFNRFQTVSQQVCVQLCFWPAAVWDAL